MGMQITDSAVIGLYSAIWNKQRTTQPEYYLTPQQYHQPWPNAQLTSEGCN